MKGSGRGLGDPAHVSPRALVVSASESAAETLDVLNAADLSVDLLCSRRTLRQLGSAYDRWIPPAANISNESEADALVGEAARLIADSPDLYHWIVLANDELLGALRDSNLDPKLKLHLAPIGSGAHLNLLHSKRETARFMRDYGFSSPPSVSCDSFEEIVVQSAAIGFPVIVKIEGTNGGAGVLRADSTADLHTHEPALRNQQVLVEKFIPGDEVSIEALYLSGALIAYNYSTELRQVGSFGPSYERRFRPCKSLMPELVRLRKVLGLNCFTYIGAILCPTGDTHFFFELDFRPNKWVWHGRLVGADFSQAIRHSIGTPAGMEQPIMTTSIERRLWHFERDLRYSLARLKLPRLLAWFIN